MLNFYFHSTSEELVPDVKKQHSTLWIVGTPLSDEGKLSQDAIECFNSADLIIAESKKVGFKYLKQSSFQESAPLYFLDPQRDQVKKELFDKMKELSTQGKQLVLFSDTGMPLLFDPGDEVLEHARRLHYVIRSVPSATSWGSACALSGWKPPFLVLGFLSREIPQRKQELSQLKSATQHIVLMDTPYRFESLLAHAAEVLGPDREAFLAWEIAKPEEKLIWGSIAHLQREAMKFSLKKGEFILIIRGLSR